MDGDHSFNQRTNICLKLPVRSQVADESIFGQLEKMIDFKLPVISRVIDESIFTHREEAKDRRLHTLFARRPLQP